MNQLDILQTANTKNQSHFTQISAWKEVKEN